MPAGKAEKSKTITDTQKLSFNFSSVFSYAHIFTLDVFYLDSYSTVQKDMLMSPPAVNLLLSSLQVT